MEDFEKSNENCEVERHQVNHANWMKSEPKYRLALSRCMFRQHVKRVDQCCKKAKRHDFEIEKSHWS
jgi:hypothetical protein